MAVCVVVDVRPVTNLSVEDKRQRNVDNQRKWRANNKDKVKAQKRRYYERTYVKKLRDKPYTSEKEHARLRKRLDTLLITDSYLRENVARRMGIAVSEVPDELLALCRPLLQLKRKIKDMRKMDNWISLEDRMPAHQQFFLAVGTSGQMMVLRCDLHQNGDHLIDYVFMHPDLTHQVKGVTHWMPLPEPPK